MFICNIKINGGIVLKMLIVILSIFMFIIFGISVYKTFFTRGKFSVKDGIMVKDITEIEPDNYTNILQAVHKDMESYVGMKIKFTGYVYRLIDFKEDEFVLARDMFINEEKTQSIVVGFLSKYPNIKDFKDGEWVELIGTIEKGKYHNKEIPIIKVTEIKTVPKPENPFVNSPEDTYIPTSGVL